jgi:hypothetical protein
MPVNTKEALVAVLALELRVYNVELTHAQRVDVVDALLRELVNGYYRGEVVQSESTQTKD